MRSFYISNNGDGVCDTSDFDLERIHLILEFNSPDFLVIFVDKISEYPDKSRQFIPINDILSNEIIEFFKTNNAQNILVFDNSKKRVYRGSRLFYRQENQPAILMLRPRNYKISGFYEDGAMVANKCRLEKK